ncbi:heterokaryon incompatibility protein-domain-containing protein [Phaeosphaeria sp. MPI-PUGE-AT-0046c]|nr:heterokaryon incompatibility protein-domain-containing protein [Phaeosphaeria sp. MPI-PUGE-AT-0046c]
MDSMLPDHQYFSITADSEIRVLKLEPATSFHDPLVASLVALGLHDALDTAAPASEFHCVSYCWGTNGNTHHMICDDQRLPITENVDMMLRHLRKVLTSRNLWIDAICINQYDDAEKAEQVTAMSLIYQLATKVHVWLGPASADDQIPSVFVALRNWALNHPQLPWIDLEEDHASLSAPLKAFIVRPWFTRRWILQEVRVARSVTVHCGPHRISWEWVRDGMRTLLLLCTHKKGYQINKELITAEMTRTLESFHSLKKYRKEEATTVLQLLWHHHSNACVDERDRIFALYGLLRSPGRYRSTPGHEKYFNHHKFCPVDYTMHFAATYSQLAAAAVIKGHGKTVITHALAFGNLAQQNPEWPSWVPAWNMTRWMSEEPSLSAAKMTVRSEEDQESDGYRIPKPYTLTLSGLLRPILTVRDKGASEVVMDFFQPVKWPSHNGPGGPIPLLLRAMHNAEDIYDRTAFDFHAVFSSPDLVHGEKQHRDGRLTPLLPYLAKELGVTPPEPHEYLEYSPEILRQEVERLMQGHIPFTYLSGQAEVPGVALTNVEVGDYVYRPDETNNLPSHALVLRPLYPPEHEKFDPDTFRLIGCCLDSESWWYRWEQRIPGPAQHEQHHDTIFLQ